MIETIRKIVLPYIYAVVESSIIYACVWLWCRYISEEKMDNGLWAATIAIMLLIRHYQWRISNEPDEDNDGY